MFDDYYRRTWEPGTDISEHQTELATSLRIPILASEYPRWNYITGVVVRGEDSIGAFEAGVMPTDDEIRLLGAHLASYNRYYRQSFLDAMKHMAPYDIDGGANLGYYMKRPDGGWCYRKRTWRYGPHWWPNGRPGNDRPLPLSHVLARNFNGWPWLKRAAEETPPPRLPDDRSDRTKWCPHGWAKLQPEGASLCPECAST